MCGAGVYVEYACVEGRELVGIHFLLLACGFQGSNLGTVYLFPVM